RSSSFSCNSRSLSRDSCSRLGWLECRRRLVLMIRPLAWRFALALIHHTIKEFATFVQQNVSKYLNCYDFLIGCPWLIWQFAMDRVEGASCLRVYCPTSYRPDTLPGPICAGRGKVSAPDGCASRRSAFAVPL